MPNGTKRNCTSTIRTQLLSPRAGEVDTPPFVTTTSTSASCGINYSDGSVWRQTVTVVFDSHGHPVTDSATLGTEVVQPTDGRP